MRALNLLLLLTPLLLICCKPQEKITQEVEKPQELRIQFYNVENLFDTIDDPETNDEEFTPTGKKNWTEERYNEKLNHLAKVLTAREDKGPSLIGLCEVENLKVVQDLAATGGLAAWDLGIVHKDSPDGRGIDVALMYPKGSFTILKEHYVESKLPSGSRPDTRLSMIVEALYESDTLLIGVNHWPSRYGGQEESEPNRLTVAYNVSKKLDELQAQMPTASVILMGDFNDYPNNKSMRSILGAGKEGDSKYVNLMWDMNKSGIGTYNYRGEWGCLDQFVVSPNLVDGSGTWVVSADDVVIPRYEWMMFTNDKGEVYPSRTYGGSNYYGGYSDHLPIDLVFRRK
jgi:hypothetical protein